MRRRDEKYWLRHVTCSARFRSLGQPSPKHPKPVWGGRLSQWGPGGATDLVNVGLTGIFNHHVPRPCVPSKTPDSSEGAFHYVFGWGRSKSPKAKQIARVACFVLLRKRLKRSGLKHLRSCEPVRRTSNLANTSVHLKYIIHIKQKKLCSYEHGSAGSER